MQRSHRRTSAAVLVAVVAAGLVTAVTSLNSAHRASAAVAVPGALWTADFSGIATPTVAPNDDVVVPACPSSSATTPQFSELTNTGTPVWTQSANAAATAECNAVATTDAANNTYVLGQSGGGTGEVLESIKADGTTNWTEPLPGDGQSHYFAPVLGWDGSVYISVRVPNTNNSEVLGFSQATGAPGLKLGLDDITGLAAYSGGLIIVRDATALDYYGYDGTLINQYVVSQSIGSYEAYSFAAGAGGTVYLAGWETCDVSTPTETVGVQKFTPSGSQWLWTETGQTCGSTAVAATPDGGAVLGWNGVDNVATYASVSPSGSTRWVTSPSPTQTLGATEGDGSAPQARVDVNGSVLLPTHVIDLGCTTNAPNPCDMLQVENVSESNKTALQPPLVVADQSDNNFSVQAMALGSGRIYAMTSSALNGVNSYTLAAYVEAGVGQDYAVASSTPGSVLPPPPPVSRYVAMGDSYSSGEGLAPYIKGTDQTKPTKDQCHRSRRAYGPILDKYARLGSLTFVACSGALTNDIINSNHSNPTESSQLGAIPADTTLVTLTIGGNDVGFSDVLRACIRLRPIELAGYNCSKDAKLIAGVSARIARLSGRGNALTTHGLPIVPISIILRDIHAAAPQAKIYIAGYPNLFGSAKSNYTSSTKAPSGLVCTVYRDGPVTGTLDYDDAQWLNTEGRALDSAISASAHEAAAAGVPVRYVSQVPTNFSSHGLCDSSSSWIFPLHLNLKSVFAGAYVWSFHPTQNGQAKGYERAFRSAIVS